jgi:hypothetical protein
MKLTLTILFFLASSTSIFFFVRLLTWVAWKIKPEHFEKGITNKNIFSYNVVMIISLILWSILFYFKF